MSIEVRSAIDLFGNPSINCPKLPNTVNVFELKTVSNRIILNVIPLVLIGGRVSIIEFKEQSTFTALNAVVNDVLEVIGTIESNRAIYFPHGK
jgi:hypothetical protein